MQLSIGRLAAILIALLITVTVATTAAGLYLLQSGYRSLEERRDAEAQDSAANAATAVGGQIRFYRDILHILSTRPELDDLLEFGDTGEITQWTSALGRLLPGTLGTALASTHGLVFGDALGQQVGAACQADLRQFAAGATLDYPLLHTDVPGFEHFDLLMQISSPSGAHAGTLFVSFRLDIIAAQVRDMARGTDRILLLDHAGRQHLAVGAPVQGPDVRTYSVQIPDTSWELQLQRRIGQNGHVLTRLAAVDAVILGAFALPVFFIVRRTLSGFATDMQRVHRALSDVLAGRHQPSAAPTAIKETGILLPDIEQLALQIQQQRDELRQQSLSDPLTGVSNRRYFDLMLNHLHEQSQRRQAAMLILIDLNDFKRINDEFGHPCGDRVLRNSADFLRSRVRASDIVARLGGDEFALMLTHMPRIRIEEWLNALVRDYGRQALAGEETAILCHCSIGAASIDSELYATPCDVFNAADAAMYEAKQRRQAGVSHFALARPPQPKKVKTAAEGP